VKPARWAIGAVALAALVVTACSQGGSTSSASGTSPSGQSQRSSTTAPGLKHVIKPSIRTGQIYVPPGRSATKGPIGPDPSQSHGLDLNILAGLGHDEPIYDGDFADPSALAVSSTLYFYASSSSPSKYDHGANVPVMALSRGDGFSGRFLGDALPKVPSWTVSGYQWGPDVWERSASSYVMYYSTPATVPLGCLATPPSTGCVKTTHGETNAECISRATSAGPTGPFVDNSTSAFICPLDEGGAIDPSVFVATDGVPWLLWKSDGDCCDEPTSIYTQQLSNDGLSTIGPPHRLLGASQPWEDKLVEAPTMIQDNNRIWLFYSGSLWGHKTYGIGIASCQSVTGPCTKPLDHSWVSSDADGVSDQGPGGEEFYETGSIVWMVHHGLAPGETGNNAQRRLYVDLVAFPSGQLPHLGARQPAAALAAAEIYFGDPSLPKNSRAAYLKVLHLAGVSNTAQDAALVAAGATVCTDLAKKKSYGSMTSTLEARHLSEYEAYLAIILAAQYQCPSRIPEATNVMVSALNRLPATS
jgi:hypothetical protein